MIRWAFANPEKIVAIGMGFVAFGVTAALLSKGREENLHSIRDDEEQQESEIKLRRRVRRLPPMRDDDDS